jgi:hypothetical protein
LHNTALTSQLAPGATLEVAPSRERPLTAEQVADFQREGFLVIQTPQIGAEELTWCRQLLMGMLTNGEGRSAGRNLDLVQPDDGQGDAKTLPTVLQPSLYATELRKLSFRSTALAIARQLLGPDASFAGDHTIYKPPHKGAATPWHQDEAFTEPVFEFEDLSIWIALNDTTPENGAMAYIPGSHKGGVLPHRVFGGEKGNTIECYEGFDPDSAVICPLPPGAMTIHHCRTVHGAGVNNSDGPRLGYILQFSTPPKLAAKARPAPWLAQLRKDNQRRRKSFLLRGGIFPELWRVLRSDRYSATLFWQRRLNALKRLLKRDPG